VPKLVLLTLVLNLT